MGVLQLPKRPTERQDDHQAAEEKHRRGVAEQITIRRGQFLADMSSVQNKLGNSYELLRTVGRQGNQDFQDGHGWLGGRIHCRGQQVIGEAGPAVKSREGRLHPQGGQIIGV